MPPTPAKAATLLPYGSQRDENDAQAALTFIHPDRLLTADIRPASAAMLHDLCTAGLGLTFHDPHQQDFVLGNIKARQRMIAQGGMATTW